MSYAAAIATCSSCSAGALLSFGWKLAKERGESDVYVFKKRMRHGSLYQCRDCGHPWYLDAGEKMMNYIPEKQIPLCEAWDAGPIHLEADHLDKLRKIGATPYGGMSVYRDTPCCVITKGGGRFNLAIVSERNHPPYESFLNECRFATEIAEIEESSFALPFNVRKATAEAGEMGMGFAPTAVHGPDKSTFLFNGANNFYDGPHGSAKDIRLSGTLGMDWSRMSGKIYHFEKPVAYFIADRDDAK